MSLQRLKCEAFNHLADKTFVSPAAIITDYAALVVLCELGIIGHQHKLKLFCPPDFIGLHKLGIWPRFFSFS